MIIFIIIIHIITWSPPSSCPPSRTECSRARGWTLWPPAGQTPPPSRTCPSSPGSGTAPAPAEITVSIYISKYILLSPGTPLAADRSRQMWRRRADQGWLRSREDQRPFELRLSSPDLNMSFTFYPNTAENNQICQKSYNKWSPAYKQLRHMLPLTLQHNT